MKKIILLGLVAILVLGMAAYVYAAAGSTKISASGPHNMEARLLTKVAGGSTEVCAFCHIPHLAATSAGVPLRNISGADSVFCMTCHDGVVEAGIVIRAPLSGTLVSGNVAASATLPAIGTMIIGSTNHVVQNTPDWAGDPKSVLVASDAAAVVLMNGTGKRKNVTTVVGSDGKIACQSCHDVHNYNDDTRPFLRRSNANSGLCSACHDL